MIGFEDGTDRSPLVDPADLSSIETFEKYELLGRLAQGGMAELYLARATGIENFQKVVVLKRILPQYADDPQFVEMFLDEARLAAMLDHPNIAQVFDIGRAGESYFFTMEYVRGPNLSTILRAASAAGTAVPIAAAVSIVMGATAALHHAHETVGLDGHSIGIVHRDVSPANILVRHDGCVKLIDFGIAKTSAQHGVTQHGTLKGKLCYMSPEQCRCEPLDRRSDIFSLGVVLFELTTGRRLFHAPSAFELLRRFSKDHLTPPSALVPDYPPALERIVLRALAGERNERFGTAEELQLALDDFAHEERLAVSTLALGRYMRTLFSDRLQPHSGARDVSPALHVVSAAPSQEPVESAEQQPATLALRVSPPGPNVASLEEDPTLVSAEPGEGSSRPRPRRLVGAIVTAAVITACLVVALLLLGRP